VIRVNVVAFENGVGNSRDLALVSHALAEVDCSVTVTRISAHTRSRRRSPVLRGLVAARRWADRQPLLRARRPKFDLNVMMEHVWPEQLPNAARNVVIPNPEWFDASDRRLLQWVDRVWTKTGHSFDAFRNLGCCVNMIGFDSTDRFVQDVTREPSFFHLAGKSRMKGTAGLVQLWSRHREWPMLTVVHSRRAVFEAVAAPNIRYETRYLDDAELRRIQNLNAFHLCLSETEGWGHYIGEAQSVGAILLVTDAKPMNELVTDERGMLVKCREAGRQHMATRYAFIPEELERGIGAALDMSGQDRLRLGSAARHWFLENKRTFTQRLRLALAEL
jgi:hypothetical protein